MNEHIILAIEALEKEKNRSIIDMGYVLRRGQSGVAAIEEAIAHLRTIENTMRIQVDRIIELQRQLMKAEESACRKA